MMQVSDCIVDMHISMYTSILECMVDSTQAPQAEVAHMLCGEARLLGCQITWPH
mgnify:CR=1 FL=1